MNRYYITWLKWIVALVVTFNVTLFSSIFIYVVMYWVLMPNIHVDYDVHFHFKVYLSSFQQSMYTYQYMSS